MLHPTICPRPTTAAPVADNRIQIAITTPRHRMWLSDHYSAFTSYSGRMSLRKMFEQVLFLEFPDAVWVPVLRAWTLPANRRAEVLGWLATVPIVELVTEEIPEVPHG